MGRYLGWSSIGYSDETWPDLGGKHRMVFFSGIIVVFLKETITERRKYYGKWHRENSALCATVFTP